ncbi:phosphate ABC transporter membrane protein 2 (PhoT family) [Hypnocyclicus thermotrophus]|uniref:Phosphate transport system permease protein PstA n=1 Tax=Hypnocyclicus thermotrophus TaxID=1627895 RepID=A0AA46I5L7_9FUSO|nr:phosphate ABC transporter permease PstA [Hypnocyclicus thermotrophus]TDT70552.1 phosphate ABC transporter membrane protein 2 (PhoT family) [Hypnocyclicus thermotrophus]
MLNRVKRRKLIDNIFKNIVFLCTMFGVVILVVLMFDILRKGLGWINLNFLTHFPSRFPKKAGLASAIVGTSWIITLTALIAFPLGVGTALYLEEYANKTTKFFKILELNIANLAGVPSIVYGMLGLSVFVQMLGFGRSILSGAFTLALLILPVVIVSAQEAIKAVPNSAKEGAYALGMTKWQMIKCVVLPYAMPGMLTGSILALSRAAGEAAPLIVVGAAAYVPFFPKNIFDIFTVMPIQIYNWTSRPQEDFQYIAAAGIIVLMILLLSANGLAIYLRNKYQQDI